MAGVRQTSAGPRRDPCASVLPRLSQPHSPRFPPLPSAPVLCLQQLRGAKQLVPRLGGPALRFPVRLAGLPLPYPLPALARSPPAPHIHTAAGRGGREGGRAADGSDGADLGLARNSGKTRPAGVLPPLSNSSSALRSCAPSPAFGPFLSADVGCGSFAPRWPARHLQLRFPPSARHSAPLRLPPATTCPLLRSPLRRGGGGGEWRGVAGSAGAVRRSPAPYPSTPAGSGFGLGAWRRRGLIITSPPAQLHSHSLTRAWGGREEVVGRMGTSASPEPASSGHPETGVFFPPVLLSCPLSSPLLSPPNTSPLHQALSPLSHPRSGFGRLTEGPGRTNFLCLEPDWTGFPFPSLCERASLRPTVLADWPEGDRA